MNIIQHSVAYGAAGSANLQSVPHPYGWVLQRNRNAIWKDLCLEELAPVILEPACVLICHLQAGV